MIATVKSERCDLGFAFDSDGDRIGVVDGAGRILWGDQYLTLMIREALGERPGATIIAAVKASETLFDEIRNLGGHIFFADRNYGYDDGLYAAVRMLSFLSRARQSLAEMIDELPKPINTPEIRFPCPEGRKFDVVAEIRDRLYAAGAEVNGIDGVRVRTDDGWWLLRASNTQDALVARCESSDEGGPRAA